MSAEFPTRDEFKALVAEGFQEPWSNVRTKTFNEVIAKVALPQKFLALLSAMHVQKAELVADAECIAVVCLVLESTRKDVLKILDTPDGPENVARRLAQKAGPTPVASHDIPRSEAFERQVSDAFSEDWETAKRRSFDEVMGRISLPSQVVTLLNGIRQVRPDFLETADDICIIFIYLRIVHRRKIREILSTPQSIQGFVQSVTPSLRAFRTQRLGDDESQKGS